MKLQHNCETTFSHNEIGIILKINYRSGMVNSKSFEHWQGFALY